jgi:pimeloyl-ACP methyl ester carboxylesterase
MPHATIGDGVRLHYEDFGSPAAPAIVLIRGTGADGTRWMPQVEAYRDEFRVVIFDNRGVGRSDTPPGPYTVAQMADDTLALMDHLDVERAHLSGSSLGGAIALHIACHHPDRVVSLQMHSSWLATHGYTSFSLGLLKRFLEVGGTEFYYEAALPLLFSPAFMSGDYERLMSILHHMKTNSASLEGLAGQIEANLTHDLRAEAPSVRVPTLVTVGELDYLLPVAASQEIAAAIPGAELIVFAGGPHLVTMESPDEFNKVTLDWLRQLKGTNIAPEH